MELHFTLAAGAAAANKGGLNQLMTSLTKQSANEKSTNTANRRKAKKKTSENLTRMELSNTFPGCPGQRGGGAAGIECKIWRAGEREWSERG